MKSLAIVIPAYKESYFHQALQSLSEQTHKDFTVYIGDDCSPDNIKSIADTFSDVLDIVYYRFETNIGAKNIVKQWSRCIDLSRGEKWLWLFSDDDLVDNNCVENFFEVANSKVDVYRFNTLVIDAQNRVYYIPPTGPSHESSVEMAYNLLLDRRGNCMPDHIFSRKIYERKGGFVFTEYAQGADWATSILFAQEDGISIIPDAKLYWRQSGVNISSNASRKNDRMLVGHLQFISWLIKHFEFLKYQESQKSSVSFTMMRDAALINLKKIILQHYKVLVNSNIAALFKLLKNDLNMSNKDAIIFIYDIKRTTPSRINLMIDFLKRLTHKTQ